MALSKIYLKLAKFIEVKFIIFSRKKEREKKRVKNI